MRNDARPIGEDAHDADPLAQEQAVQRSPAGRSQPGGSVVDEHAASSNTQHSNGLAGGSRAGGPERTPERRREDARENPTMPGDEATARTEI